MTIEKTEEELAQTERRQPRYSFVRMLTAANVCACVCTVQATEAEWGAASDRADFRLHKVITEQLHAALQLSACCHSSVKGAASDACVCAVQAIEAGQGPGDDWAEFKYRHRQAEQDSHLLYSVLQQAEQFHQVGPHPHCVVMSLVMSFKVFGRSSWKRRTFP